MTSPATAIAHVPAPNGQTLFGTATLTRRFEKRHRRQGPGGRVAMQGTANPRTSVRFRPGPPPIFVPRPPVPNRFHPQGQFAITPPRL